MGNRLIAAISVLIISWIILGNAACVTDKLPPVDDTLLCDTVNVTYAVEMKPIIDTYCGYSGCHVSGSGIGNFTSYAGILSYLESGQIEDRALEQQDMPPAFSEGPDELTPEDFDTFKCWIENGFPEL